MKSPYLDDFLDKLGNAVHNINTLIVGLSAVEEGKYTKPDSLTITWETKDNIASARKARLFMLKSALIYIDDAISNYLKDIRPLSKDELLVAVLSRRNPQFIDELEDKFKRDKPQLYKLFNSRNTYKKKEGDVERLYKTIDSSDRLRSLKFFFDIPKDYWLPATILLNKWRNRVVHAVSVAIPEKEEINILISSSQELREQHSNIDIQETIDNFENNRITLKDITTLIAISIKLVREIDNQIYKKINTLSLIESYVKSKNHIKEYNAIVSNPNEKIKRRKYIRFVKTKITHIDDATIDYLLPDVKKISN